MDPLAFAELERLFLAIGDGPSATVARETVLEGLDIVADRLCRDGFKLSPAPNYQTQNIVPQCLNSLFGPWKNGVQDWRLQTPAMTERRLTEYRFACGSDTSLRSYLGRHFGTEVREAAEIVLPVLQKAIGLTPELVRYGHSQLPKDLAIDAADAACAVLSYDAVLHILGRSGEDVAALYQLTNWLTVRVVVRRIKSFGSGHRKWLALTD